MPTNPAAQALTPASPAYHTNVAPMPTQPAQDRVVSAVPAMPIVPLSIEHVFDAKSGKPRLDRLKEHFLKEGRLDKECAKRLIREASALFKAEPNLLDLRYPITVCGDIHGQYYDLIRLFDVGGDPKDTQYLFLGDYVDRGCFSCEVVFYLYAHKIFYPKTFFMLRGNHECRQLTSFFNFKDECQYKYDVELYDLIMDSFDHLPIGAMVNRSFFCVHGGLSPEIATLSDISSLDRHQETPREGPMCDLLWSDPYDEEGGMAGDAAPMSDSDHGGKHSVALNTSAAAATWFVYNETRQCSYIYGSDAVRQFLDDNKITSIIRAHEAQVDGYKMHMVNAETGIPRVITIFSAPNYCDVYKNKAACLKFDHPNILNIKQFVETQHPYYLPNFMDVFQWSLPFVAEKVTDMLASVLDFNIEDAEAGGKTKPLESRGNLLKKKVMAVTKLVRMYKILREQSEAIVQLKQLTPNHRLPVGVLSSGAEGIKDALTVFEKARVADRESERHPCPSPPTALLQRRFSRTFSTAGETPLSSPVLMLKARLDAAPIEGLGEGTSSSGFASPTLKVELE
jgi:serine/threonine-protein phosphatase 2B catalytic subunit